MILSMLPEFSNEFEWKTKTNKKIQALFQSDEKMVFVKPYPYILFSSEVSYLIMIHNYRLNLAEEI